MLPVPTLFEPGITVLLLESLKNKYTFFDSHKLQTCLSVYCS